ncbi:MAG: hypothetical protein E6J91_08135 [Deltaproteobacteria bacterium]|nr:MAG: hypothetical protein E6J91_08135 [Deltaproteobacteria bacterium]
MGRTALYRDPAPFRPARAEIQLDGSVVQLAMPDGKQRRLPLDGCAATLADGCFAARGAPRSVARPERRFVRMLILERGDERHVIITPPELGAVAPNVVRLPEAPDDAAIIDGATWDALTDWVMGGGRLTGYSIADLARIAAIASWQFAATLGEVAAERALELVEAARGPLRGVGDLDAVLHPLAAAARQSPRVAHALLAALARAADPGRHQRRA